MILESDMVISQQDSTGLSLNVRSLTGRHHKDTSQSPLVKE